MSATIHGISWFPNIADKFVIWGQEILLYEAQSQKLEKSGNQTNTTRQIPGQFLAIENRYQYARCVQPSFYKERPIIACGLGDGKVGICNFQDTVDSGWEFTPRQQRMCLCLAWNELEPNILAIGHDRHRSDSCITIWDIDRGLPKETGRSFGLSESAHSMCWDKNHKLLISGMSQKQIKLLDYRQNGSSQYIVTKSVHGLSVAPDGNTLCSYVDSVITLWDLRAIDRPLKHMQSSKNHMSLNWCPTRQSLLSSLHRESPYITFYDIRCADVENSREVCHIKRQLLPFASKSHVSNKGFSLTAQSWHTQDFERALFLTEAGNILDFRLPLAIHTGYSNRKKLPLLFQRPICPTTYVEVQQAVHNQEQQQLISPSQPIPNQCYDDMNFIDLVGLHVDVLDQDLLESDLLQEMQTRAHNDYGIVDCSQNDYGIGDLNLDSYLKNVWSTLGNLYNREGLTGLKTILGIGVHTSEALMATSRIKTQVLQWPDVTNSSNNLVCYRSEQRDVALKLCGWPYEQDLERFIGRLCDNKEFGRAAMIYVFHLKTTLACDILNKAATDAAADASMFRIAAFALSHFNATWRTQHNNDNMQLDNAHLRAIFSFLITENDNFESVLNEEEISLSDRMAFACRYLSESKLSEYVRAQIQKSIENGDLNGLLLTGESMDGINILQSFMDGSSDVQTVALIAINYFLKDHFENKRIQYWIASYLDFLNCWGLWEKRAQLDITIESFRPSQRARNVYLACNFCGKSVCNTLQEDVRLRSASSNINKLSSCPSCRKPLPRCSLCLLHMGTTLLNTNATTETDHGSQEGWRSKPFSKWYAWCQTCRHGGHTEHLMQWFKQYTECPVSSCSCNCFDIDALTPMRQNV